MIGQRYTLNLREQLGAKLQSEALTYVRVQERASEFLRLAQECHEHEQKCSEQDKPRLGRIKRGGNERRQKRGDRLFMHENIGDDL